jgi:hypothetical protein
MSSETIKKKTLCKQLKADLCLLKIEIKIRVTMILRLTVFYLYQVTMNVCGVFFLLGLQNILSFMLVYPNSKPNMSDG